jgi:hypothetical protein
MENLLATTLDGDLGRAYAVNIIMMRQARLRPTIIDSFVVVDIVTVRVLKILMLEVWFFAKCGGSIGAKAWVGLRSSGEGQGRIFVGQ